jgi:hypothetical protein
MVEVELIGCSVFTCAGARYVSERTYLVDQNTADLLLSRTNDYGLKMFKKVDAVEEAEEETEETPAPKAKAKPKAKRKAKPKAKAKAKAKAAAASEDDDDDDEDEPSVSI